MTFRDDILECVDAARNDCVDGIVGLRLFVVTIETRTWPRGRVGQGQPESSSVTFGAQFGSTTPGVSPIELVPVPRVSQPSPRLRLAAPGKYEDGDRVVDKISGTLVEADLTGGTLLKNVERIWRIDGDSYRLVGEPEKLYTEWRCHLRRTRDRPAGV